MYYKLIHESTSNDLENYGLIETDCKTVGQLIDLVNERSKTENKSFAIQHLSIMSSLTGHRIYTDRVEWIYKNGEYVGKEPINPNDWNMEFEKVKYRSGWWGLYLYFYEKE